MNHLPDPVTQPEFYENVPAKRLLAWVFDVVLILILCLVILPFTGFTAIFFFPFLWMVVSFSYRVISIANQSATFGMRIAAIELRNREGMRLNLIEATLHTLGYALSFGIFLVQVASIILMCASMRGQSLTDHVLGTVMLNRSARR